MTTALENAEVCALTAGMALENALKLWKRLANFGKGLQSFGKGLQSFGKGLQSFGKGWQRIWNRLGAGAKTHKSHAAKKADSCSAAVPLSCVLFICGLIFLDFFIVFLILS